MGQKQKTEKKKKKKQAGFAEPHLSSTIDWSWVGLIFRPFFLLFTASVRSRPPGPPAVPGVFQINFFVCVSLSDNNERTCS